MFFHASQVPELKILTPHVSNHGQPLVYFSTKRENVFVYLSNAVEKYCHQIGYPHNGRFQKWGSYGFTKDGILQLDEYYPHATVETYKGVSGYIYSVNTLREYKMLTDIPDAVATDDSVAVEQCEFIPDAYEALLEAAEKGKLLLTRYEENSIEKTNWIKKTIVHEYEQSSSSPEYRLFLKAKFGFMQE